MVAGGAAWSARSVAQLTVLMLLFLLPAHAGSAGASTPAAAERVVFIAGIGPELAHYDVDVANGSLSRVGAVSLPGNVLYAWPHPSNRFLYVGWSSRGNHGLSAFRIEPSSGSLIPLGDPVSLGWGPVHLSVDIPGTHILVAYINPSGASVHALNPDGTIGGEVESPEPLEGGVFGHQIRVMPSNRSAVLVARGNEARPTAPEDPGALKILDYDDGVLRNRTTIAPGGGYGFQPRHVDFHPTQPWMYLAVERQHKLEMYRFDENDVIDSVPAFRKTTLDEPTNLRPEQMAGAIHVHPNGRFVYVSNRANGTVEVSGTHVAAGGENTIAVFSIDQTTGEPTLIQNMDTRGFHPRTFSIDESGTLLVAANTTALAVRSGAELTTVPASLSVFRIVEDGRLEFIRKHDIEPGRGSPFWSGFVTLPGAPRTGP